MNNDSPYFEELLKHAGFKSTAPWDGTFGIARGCGMLVIYSWEGARFASVEGFDRWANSVAYEVDELPNTIEEFDRVLAKAKDACEAA